MSKMFSVNDNIFCNSEEVAKYIITNVTDDEIDFDEVLDNNNDIVTICGYQYKPSEIFKQMNPEAYMQEAESYVEEQCTWDIANNCYRMKPGDEDMWWSFLIKCFNATYYLVDYNDNCIDSADTEAGAIAKARKNNDVAYIELSGGGYSQVVYER